MKKAHYEDFTNPNILSHHPPHQDVRGIMNFHLGAMDPKMCTSLTSTATKHMALSDHITVLTPRRAKKKNDVVLVRCLQSTMSQQVTDVRH